MTVLCASCGASVDEADACTSCGAPTRLDGRYRLLSIVGQGAAGVTYRGEVCADGAPVAVKEMPLRHTVDEKARERMAREARVLRQLDHTRVPAYVDHFEVGEGKQRAFHLVQAFIDGRTLDEEMKDRRYTEAEVVDILEELLDVLGYMHRLQPPVVHRDLKPRNVIRRERDGKLVLIDFGAVRDVLKDPALGGSTVAGTYGYMAPEQFRGDATPASDLYALGVLAVVLLSRKDPLDLVRPDHSLDWRPHVNASEGLKQAIDTLLEIDPELRAQRAADVSKALRARPSKLTRRAPVPAAGTTALAVRRPYLHRGLATTMAFVTAPFGGHNFYLGRKGRGILSILFFWTLIPLFLSVADGIRFSGMTRREFDREFNPEWPADDEDERALSVDGFGDLRQLARLPGEIIEEVFEALGDEFRRHGRGRDHHHRHRRRRKRERDRDD